MKTKSSVKKENTASSFFIIMIIILFILFHFQGILYTSPPFHNISIENALGLHK